MGAVEPNKPDNYPYIYLPPGETIITPNKKAQKQLLKYGIKLLKRGNKNERN